MKYQKLGNTEINVSIVSMGTWGLGGGSVWADADPQEKTAALLLDQAEKLGINYIDTAPVYGTGHSEELLGKALQGRRDHFVLQTKVSLNWRNDGGSFKYERDGVTVRNNTTAKAIRQDIEDSLMRLRTDYIDVAVVHYVNKTETPVAETMQALQELIREGKIRAAALSNSQPDDYLEYTQYGDIALVQEQYSLLAPFHGESYFPYLKNTVFQVYGALEEGFLTDPAYCEREFANGDIRARLPWQKEPYKSGIHNLFKVMKPMTEKYACSYANLVEAWTLCQYPQMNLLIGFRRPQTMADTCRCLDVKLTEADRKQLAAVAAPVQVKELDK